MFDADAGVLGILECSAGPYVNWCAEVLLMMGSKFGLGVDFLVSLLVLDSEKQRDRTQVGQAITVGRLVGCVVRLDRTCRFGVPGR